MLCRMGGVGTGVLIFLLDKYIHSNLVYYKQNGADEPYDLYILCSIQDEIC